MALIHSIRNGKGKIYIYQEENHKRPHFHILVGENEYSIALDNFEMLAGNIKTTDAVFNELMKFAKSRQKDLLKLWYSYNKH